MSFEEASTSLALIGAVWFIAAVVPGPEVLAIVHATATGGRSRGMAMVVGIVAGTVLWGIAGYSGIAVLFSIAPWAYLLLKIVGGGYLVLLGIRLLLAGPAEEPVPGPCTRSLLAGAWGRGLAINLANPETAVLVASMYAVSLPADPGLLVGSAVTALIAGISLAWYTLLVLAVGAGRWDGLRRNFGRLIRTCSGGIMIALGARIVLSRGG